MDDILALVRASLNAPVSTQDGTQDTERQYPAMVGTVHTDEWVAYEDAETGANDIEFDDTGEGVGVEGDLDMDDD
jgi:hypothetical protein